MGRKEKDESDKEEKVRKQNGNKNREEMKKE